MARSVLRCTSAFLGVAAFLMAVGLVVGCHPTQKNERPEVCAAVGQSCMLPDGRIGSCVAPEGCTGASCLACQSQH